jgi:hypothetical protein
MVYPVMLRMLAADRVRELATTAGDARRASAARRSRRG